MKAIALLSGGLDSILATRLIIDQGIEVEAVNFVTVFCNCTSGGKTCLAAKSASDELGIGLKVFEASSDFFEIIKNPKHGYGRNLNPCLDCRIFMFRKAFEYMKSIGASFIVTGEVLGERPMSQRKQAIDIIEEESGLKGLIVRPLSAKRFAPSIPEIEGWVDREKFMDIEGRSRKPQIKLAHDLGINDYPCPAGGCLLTDDIFAKRMRDLMKHEPNFGINDVKLLKTGRVFRFSPTVKLIVGRDEKENDKLLILAKEGDIYFEPVDIPGPSAVLRGVFDENYIIKSAALIAKYCGVEPGVEVKVSYRRIPSGESISISAFPIKEDDLETCRV